MGRGQRRARSSTRPARPGSPSAAVGVVENPAYPFQALVDELGPVVEELRAANAHNEPLDRDDVANAVWLNVSRLYGEAYPVWSEMWDHYHDRPDHRWESGTPFDELTYAVADFCEGLEHSRPHSREIVGSEPGDRLIAAYDAFVQALAGFYSFQTSPLQARSRVSPLAARQAS